MRRLYSRREHPHNDVKGSQPTMSNIASRGTRNVLASLAMLTPMVGPAFAEPITATEVDARHKALENKHVTGQTRRGGDLFWDNDPSGKMTITALSPPGDRNRTINYAGEWSVNEEGRYCVQAHPAVQQGGDWQFCKRVEAASDGSMSFVVNGSQHFTIR
jgi:hypothetical protein